MNSETIISSAAVSTPAPYFPGIGIESIDEKDVPWKFRFSITMLRLARILITTGAENLDIRAKRISKLLDKHRKVTICSYTPLQIREQFWIATEEIRGGGYKVEWIRLDTPHRRNDPPHYCVSFTRLYLPEEDTPL